MSLIIEDSGYIVFQIALTAFFYRDRKKVILQIHTFDALPVPDDLNDHRQD
jgi:hypothetical protein